MVRNDRIPRIQGGTEVTFSGHAQLTSTTTRQVWARPPIDVDFQVLMFTASGLIVRFLKVFEKSNYNSIKWVRYLTKASGSYQIRVSFMPKLHLYCAQLTSSPVLKPSYPGLLSDCTVYPYTANRTIFVVMMYIQIPSLSNRVGGFK